MSNKISSIHVVAVGVLLILGLLVLPRFTSDSDDAHEIRLEQALDKLSSKSISTGTGFGTGGPESASIAWLKSDPLPMINEESAIALAIMPTRNITDAQVVLEIPEYWTVGDSIPEIDDESIDTASWESLDRPYDSRYLVWEGSLVAGEAAVFGFVGTPTEGDEDQWHSRFSVYVADQAEDFATGKVGVFYARVGNENRAGSFVDDYPDTALDLEFMADEGSTSGSIEEPVVVYSNGTSQPMETALASSINPIMPDTGGVISLDADWDVAPTEGQTSTLEIYLGNLVTRGVAFELVLHHRNKRWCSCSILSEISEDKGEANAQEIHSRIGC